MKRLFLITILMTFILGVTQVKADYEFGVERHTNMGDECNPLNSRWNPTLTVLGTKNGVTEENIIYDITHVKMEGSILKIYGWAFNKGQNTTLGLNGDGIQIVATTESNPNSISTTNGKTQWFDITYARQGQNAKGKGLTYYDLSYWNCMRNENNQCKKNDMEILQGGFEASLNLDEIPEGNYKLYLKVGTVGGSLKSLNWVQLAASTDSKDESLAIDNVDSDYKIAISGFGNTAQILTTYGRLTGENGLICSSPIKNTIKREYSYFNRYSVYSISKDDNGNLISSIACRGDCTNNNISYYQRMFRLIINSTPNKDGRYFPGTKENGLVAYAPASWLRFSGTITIKKEKDNEKQEPSDEDIKENVDKYCEGEETTTISYYLLELKSKDDIDKFIKDNSTLNLKSTNTSNATFSQNVSEFINIGADTVYGYSYTTAEDFKNETKLNDFYDKWIRLANTSDYYIKEGNTIYVTHKEYSNSNGSGTANLSPFKSKTVASLKKATLTAQTNIQMNDKPSGNRMRVTVTRNYKKDVIKSEIGSPISINTASGIKDYYLSPAILTIKYCSPKKTEEPVCEDDIQSAECLEDDIGTHAKFFEDDNLASCTLKNGNNSGFEIVSSNETGGLCNVACKDDIDIYLPTIKTVAAGQFFTLNNYVPKITGKRTCVTSKVDYSAFEQKLTEAENDMISKYNIWQDYKYIYENLRITVSNNKSGSESGVPCTPWKDEETGKSGCSGGCSACSWSSYDWNIPSIGAENGMIYSGLPGSYYYSTGGCCKSTSGTTSSDALASVKATYNTYTNNAKTAYDSAKATYNTLIANYKKCSKWENDTEFTFKPNVTFNYDDKDDSLLENGSYTYNYDKIGEVTTEKSSSSKYWKEDENTDSTYTKNGDNTVDEITRNIIECTGYSCSKTSDTDIINNIFVTSSYIKREEEISYTYKLPTLRTLIPSGKITTSNSATNSLILAENSVPININTPEGTYEYSFKISNISDDLRDGKEFKTENKLIEERIEEIYNDENSKYTCEYNVLNDILIKRPPNSLFPPVTHEKNGLNYFYRTVDPVDINPNNRLLGYNWSSPKAEKVRENMEKGALDYEEQTSKDKFTFVLTPAIMKEIRSYNGNQNNNGGYSDWNLNCTDYDNGGYYCKSNLLSCLASSGTSNEQGYTSCYEIFGNTLNNYNKLTDYNKAILDDNRQKLIDKMNNLDGR